MAWEARSGWKLSGPSCTLPLMWRLNGLGSPFGLETTQTKTQPSSIIPAKWPGKPVRGRNKQLEERSHFSYVGQMAWEARSGLKIQGASSPDGCMEWLNGLGSPFGFETRQYTTVALRERKAEASPSPSSSRGRRGEVSLQLSCGLLEHGDGQRLGRA